MPSAISFGNWCLPYTFRETQFLAFHYLGYEDYILPIDVRSENPNPTTVYLKPEQITLQEVLVKDKPIFVTVHGDTLEYHAAHYKSDSDQSLSDLLSRMEGVEVTADGEILYQSKRIDKLLIEGKDLLNDQHQFVLELLKPADIKKIQIINNYRPLHENFIDRITSKTAMNFILEDHAKDILRGNGEIGVGIKQYASTINLYKVLDSIGYSGFMRSNNVGKPVISSSDFLNLESNLVRVLSNTGGDLESMLPEFLARDDKISKSTEHVLAFNLERNASATTDKLSVLSAFFNRNSAYNSQRTYPESGDVTTGVSKDEYLPLYANIRMGKSIEAKNQAIFEFDLPVTFKSSGASSSFQGHINNIESYNFLKSDQSEWTLLPTLYFSQKIPNNFFYKQSRLFSFGNQEKT